MDTNASFASHPQIASTYVMQRRYELKDIESWLFSQVRPYDAKKLRKPVPKQEFPSSSGPASGPAASASAINNEGSDSEETKEQD